MLTQSLFNGIENMVKKRYDIEISCIDIESKIGKGWVLNNILVFIPDETEEGNDLTKIKNEQVAHIYFLMQQNNLSHAIVPYSAIAPQALETLTSHSHFRVEIFKYKHLLFDPTSHKKTPRHFKVINISEELPKIKVEDLPQILYTDPIVRFYDWDVGNVIGIERNDGMLYYRVIVRAKN